MYEYFKGKIVSKIGNKVIIDVNNIGYRISVPLTMLDKLSIGEETKIYTHFHVREDDMSLYGFENEHDLFLYEIIISMSGIGPKVGIAILSTMPSQEVGLAIATGDTKKLTSVPGIGNKMAQRIVLELKDKITKEQLMSNIIIDESSKSKSEESYKIKEEVMCALQVLGYSNREIQNCMQGENMEDLGTEDAIKLTLKKLSAKK